MRFDHLIEALTTAFHDLTGLYNLYEKAYLLTAAEQDNYTLLRACRSVFGRYTNDVFLEAARFITGQVDWILKNEYRASFKREDDAREIVDTLCGETLAIIRVFELAHLNDSSHCEAIRRRARNVLLFTEPRVSNLIDALDFLEIVEAIY